MNHLNTIIGCVIVAILVMFVVLPSFTGGGVGSSDSTTITNPWTFEENITVSSADVTVNTDDLFVDDSTDRVGLGTTTPQSRLHLEDEPAGDGTIATTTVIIGQTGTTTSRASFEMKQADGGVSCIYPDEAGTALIVQDGACN